MDAGPGRRRAALKAVAENRRIATIGGGFHAAGSGKAKRLCAEIGGISLHAATRCRAGDRFRLARLCRYVMRPAFADDQLSSDGAARVTFELKTPGATAPPISR